MGEKDKVRKTGVLTGLLVLLMFSSAWAGDSVVINLSCTIPSIPGVNAPAPVPEMLIRNYQRQDVANKNSTATVGDETIVKEESKETLLAQGEKVAAAVKTIYAR
jgi:hypothetical protein